MCFDEITASSLVNIDRQGNTVPDSPFPVNPAGFVIHSAIHAARHDARCVLHTHTVSGVAVEPPRPAATCWPGWAPGQAPIASRQSGI